jgi:excinuclease UvrABC ATPase subunit
VHARGGVTRQSIDLAADADQLEDGKSSLALGVLHAEGLRRFLRGFTPRLQRQAGPAARARFDRIDFLPPAMALRQHPPRPGSRSTVGTLAGLLTPLRVLISRAGAHPGPQGHPVGPFHGEAADCPRCGARTRRPTAESFAFNGSGACPDCGGTGERRDVDLATLVPDESLSIAREGGRARRRACRARGPSGHQEGPADPVQRHPGRGLADAVSTTLGEPDARLRPLPSSLPGPLREPARLLAGEVTDRLAPLLALGAGYLTADRDGATLSTGELQRIQLAATVLGRATGTLYVLDEPSIGLHPENITALGGLLRDLVADGNSVVLVDHDPGLLRGADHLIELGARRRERGRHRRGHRFGGNGHEKRLWR